MKRLIAAASVLALAACAEAEAPEAEVEEEVAVEEASEDLGPGTYTVTYADGTSQDFDMTAEGTWSTTGEDGEAVTGTYEDVDGKTCFSVDESEDAPVCWTDEERAEDGSWQSTNDEGETVTVSYSAE